MLTELEIEEIRQDLANGVVGRRMATWVEKLLLDRGERIQHEREVAVQLLATAPVHMTAHEHHGPPPHGHRPHPVSRA
jgi:hypothetical protein